MLVPVRAGERALCALLAEDVVLLGGQLGAPIGVGLRALLGRLVESLLRVEAPREE